MDGKAVGCKSRFGIPRSLDTTGMRTNERSKKKAEPLMRGPRSVLHKIQGDRPGHGQNASEDSSARRTMAVDHERQQDGHER